MLGTIEINKKEKVFATIEINKKGEKGSQKAKLFEKICIKLIRRGDWHFKNTILLYIFVQLAHVEYLTLPFWFCELMHHAMLSGGPSKSIEVVT